MPEIKGKTLKDRGYQEINGDVTVTSDVDNSPSVPMTVNEEDFISYENDTVRVFNSIKEVLPGVEIETKTFRVYLNSDLSTYLEFREPDTGECLETISRNKEKAKLAARQGKGDGLSEEEAVISFICSLSIGEVVLTRSLLKKLPIKYQYRIMRTIERITEAQGTKLTL